MLTLIPAIPANSTQLDGDNFNLVVGLVRLRIRFSVADVLYHLHALESAAKDRVLVVQPGLRRGKKSDRDWSENDNKRKLTVGRTVRKN